MNRVKKYGLMERYVGANITKLHEDLPIKLKKFLIKHQTINQKTFYNKRLSFFISCQNRIGKTWAFHSIANKIINDFNEKSLYYVCMPDLQKLFISWEKPDSPVPLDLVSIAGTRILFIDDFGLEYQKEDSEFVRSKIDQFLRWRLGGNKITYIGSKISGDLFIKKYGQSLYDFIQGEYVTIDVDVIEGFNIGRKIITTKLRG